MIFIVQRKKNFRSTHFILCIYLARRKFKSLTIHKIIINIEHISASFNFKK